MQTFFSSTVNIFNHLILINLPYAVVTNNVVIISSAFNSCTTKVFRLVPDNLKNQMKMRNTRQKTNKRTDYIHTCISNINVKCKCFGLFPQLYFVVFWKLLDRNRRKFWKQIVSYCILPVCSDRTPQNMCSMKKHNISFHYPIIPQHLLQSLRGENV